MHRKPPPNQWATTFWTGFNLRLVRIFDCEGGWEQTKTFSAIKELSGWLELCESGVDQERSFLPPFCWRQSCRLHQPAPCPAKPWTFPARHSPPLRWTVYTNICVFIYFLHTDFSLQQPVPGAPDPTTLTPERDTLPFPTFSALDDKITWPFSSRLKNHNSLNVLRVPSSQPPLISVALHRPPL